jgi:hypothetical protein
MIRLYILSFIILALYGNTFCQQNEQLAELHPKLRDKNSGNQFSFLEKSNLKEYSKINKSFIGYSKLVETKKLKIGTNLVNPDDIKTYPIWIPISEIIGMNIGINLFSNYVLHNDYSKISFASIAQNFKTGFVWDSDKFNTNFFAHPYHGGLYFNIARSNGYSYWASTAFVLGGSLMWETLMETDPPQTNDMIMTTLGGIFLGETLHRLSSLVIDDRKTGFERVMREIGAGLIDIPRGVNRLFQTKSWKVDGAIEYEREPLALDAYYGLNWNNYGTKVGTGVANGAAGFGLIYGNPYEKTKRDPMDFFRLQGNFNFGAGQPGIASLEGYGLLFGRTYHIPNKRDYLFGLFHNYDFFENQAYEIGAVSFGGGWITRFKTSEKSLFISAILLNLTPFGASKSDYVDENNRNYSFSGGANTKLESSMNFNWGTFYIGYNLFWFYTYVGVPGNELYGIFRPKVLINVSKDIELGAQFMFAHKVGYYHDHENINARTTQTMLLLQYTFGDMKFLRSGD